MAVRADQWRIGRTTIRSFLAREERRIASDYMRRGGRQGSRRISLMWSIEIITMSSRASSQTRLSSPCLRYRKKCVFVRLGVKPAWNLQAQCFGILGRRLPISMNNFRPRSSVPPTCHQCARWHILQNETALSRITADRSPTTTNKNPFFQLRSGKSRPTILEHYSALGMFRISLHPLKDRFSKATTWILWFFFKK